MTKKGQALSVLLVSTLAFTVCFMVWMMFGAIGIPIKKALNLNATEFGLLTATPALTGSLIRVPLGIWTDKFGGRIVMASLMALTIPAIWLMSYATEFWHSSSSGSSSASPAVPSRSDALRRALVSAAPAGFRDGHLRRRQLGRGGLISSSLRRWWWPSGGPPCRRSTPGS